MRISVNLATRPFVELRPFFLRLRVIMAALAVVAVALLIVNHALAVKLARAKDDMARTHNAIVATEQQKNAAERRMRQPVNAAVLERAHFLNALFLRKSFSWTAVMMDLETVLPVGVQVTAIEPQVTPEGDVAIRLRVSGDRDRAVELVRNLERSRRFLHPRLMGESSQQKDNARGTAMENPGTPAGVEFDILAEYNPLPANESYHFAKPKMEAMTQPVPADATPLGARLARAGQLPPSQVAAPHGVPRYGVVLPPYRTPGAQPQQAQPAQQQAPQQQQQQTPQQRGRMFPFQRPARPGAPGGQP
jgi:type IV pilus assembly protein PilN